MSILERVTITGADDSISPLSLALISDEFRFVEWGILVSASNINTPRYPSAGWMTKLCDYSGRVDVSAHVQGRWLRRLLLGKESELVAGAGDILKLARRIQLNFHGGSIDYDIVEFIFALERFGPKQFLFQIDGCSGGALLEQVAVEHCGIHNLDCVPFYDTSHGAGVLPSEWPSPSYQQIALADDGFIHTELSGYAGGLGPENLAEQIPLIAKAAGEGRFWIDMESRVRTDGKFDLSKALAVLQICEPFVGKEL